MKLSAIDFAQRRKQFLSQIKGAVALFPAAPAVIRNDDVHYEYRQESNFFYLTGFAEADSFVLLSPQSKTPFQIFVHPKDPKKELWEGKVLGPEAAKSELGADAAFASSPVDVFEEAFVKALHESDRLYYRLGLDAAMDARVVRLMQRAAARLGRTGRGLWPIHDPNEILGEMRLFKTKSEIERMARAAEITAEGHAEIMRMVKPGMHEYEVEAALYHAFRARGAGRLGYGSIVASGANACVLHYVQNDRKMTDRDLLLVDAGAEFDYYSADITRVCPVGGRFTSAQKEVYSAVLAAQKAALELARPGSTLRQIHQRAVEALVEELKKLKVLKGPSAGIIKKREYFEYYPHNTGHWLGMDVHDRGRYFSGNYEEPRKLEPGMVFTVEPGLYFSPTGPGPEKYRGIGIRIEDDVVVTAQGCRILTSGVPKEIEEIESLCAKG